MNATVQPDGARKVGIGLGVGIFFLPIVFAWFLLRKGHSTVSRVLGFAWLGLGFLVMIANAGSNGAGSSTNKTTSSKPSLSELQANAVDDADLTIKRYGTPDGDRDNLNEHAPLAERYLTYKKENVCFYFVGKGKSSGEAPGWKLVLTRSVNDTKSSVSLDSTIIEKRMKNRDITQVVTDGAGSKQQPIRVQAKDLYHAYAYDSSGDSKFKNSYVIINGLVSDTSAIMKDDLDNALNIDERHEMPSAAELQQESKINHISEEALRKTYPSICLVLSSTSRGTNGMGLWGDVLLVFNTHPEDLKKLKKGSQVEIIGQVTGWRNDVVIVNDCRLLKKP